MIKKWTAFKKDWDSKLHDPEELAWGIAYILLALWLGSKLVGG